MGEADFDVDGHAFAAYLCSLAENTFNKEQVKDLSVIRDFRNLLF